MVRAYAWGTLLRARAIENLCYVVGVNRLGTDGNGVEHTGGSLAVDFLGEVLTDMGAAESEQIIYLEKAPLEKYRQRFPAHLDADSFSID
jgi:omega-amidase